MTGRRRTVALGSTIALAVAVPLADGGGYAPRSQWLGAGCAVLAAAVAARIERRPLLRALRTPAVSVLIAIAVLAALSSLWAIALPGDGLRWAAVLIGFGCVASASATLARRPGGLHSLLVILCAMAFITALTGLLAAFSFDSPYAERINHRWRPGGPLEYPPALALVQVMALPALLRAMARGRTWPAALATLAAAVAGATIALSQSRLQISLALALVVVSVALPAATIGARRAIALGAAAVPVISAIAARMLAGGWTSAHADSRGGAALLALSIVLLGTAAGWPTVRSRIARMPLVRSRRPLTALAATCCMAIAILTTLGSGGSQPGGATHGRVEIWQAAIVGFSERPLSGAGAGTFLAATVNDQPEKITRFAHDLPLELAVELGVVGLLLAFALYGACAWQIWCTRASSACWLASPAVAAFLISNLFDWPWHLTAVGALWALALGCLIAARDEPSPGTLQVP